MNQDTEIASNMNLADVGGQRYGTKYDYRFGRARKPDKMQSVFRNLSMSNQEKILRQNYGTNFEQQVSNMHSAQQVSPSRVGNLKGKRTSVSRKSGTAQGGARKTGYGTVGGMIDPYRDESNMYDSPMRGMSYKDQYIDMMGRSAGRIDMRQRVIERRIKAAEDHDNLKAVNQKKLEKKEKEKAKKAKEDESSRYFDIEKKAEQMHKVTEARKGIFKDHKHKMEDLGQKLEDRVGGYGVKEIREAMLPPNLRTKTSAAFLTQRDDLDSDDGHSPDLQQDQNTKTIRLGQSQSANKIGNRSMLAGSNLDFNATSSKMNFTREDVTKSLSNIENKIVKAQKNRELMMKKKISKSIDRVRSKQEEAKMRVFEDNEKHSIDIMGKVIVKHSNAQKRIKKAQKQEEDDRMYNIDKNADKDIAFKQKLKSIFHADEEKRRALKQKAKEMDEKQSKLNDSFHKMVIDKQVKREGKTEEQNQHYTQLKRTSDTYKMHLVNRLMEKSNRAQQLAMAKKQVEKSAFKYNTLEFQKAMAHPLDTTV